MSAVITTYEDIVNAALARLKAPIRVGKLAEGSQPAKIALDTIGQLRDRLLRGGDWGFARRDAVLTLLKSAPAGGYITVSWDPVTYPPLPWRYAYGYPADCLKVRAIKPQPSFVPDFAPSPVVFETPNTYISATPDPNIELKCIVCNVPSAILTYTGQVTDPSLWEVSFVEAMISGMADILAPAIDPQAVQVEQVEEAVDEQQAAHVQG